jgi:4-hydroxyphenylacetate 3-monooxygenase
VRFHEKMKLIVGLASKIAHASGANEVPAVREVLGRFAALEAALGGMIAGQIQDAEDWSVPATLNAPSRNSRSRSAASSR